jgi:iron(III) transport system ATP-binding protein
MTGYLRVEHVTKRFGNFTALNDVIFTADKGEFICILGPSGCGKTTLLRVIAGLDTQTSGKVYFGDRDVSSFPVSHRNVGIVFQSYALFPNLTAASNVAYGLNAKRIGKDAVRNKVQHLLELVGLSGMETKYPGQLSGGQQQRVALARAMALSPDLLLLDEPLSALDAKVRVMLRSEIRSLQQRLGVTTIMVTHDQEEALTMADRILVMEKGQVMQSGSPQEVYEKPETPFVASFIGSMNFIEQVTKCADGTFRKNGFRFEVSSEGHGFAVGSEAIVAIRPEDVQVADSGTNLLRAVVRQMEYRGPVYRVVLGLLRSPVTIEADVAKDTVRDLMIQDGMDISIRFPARRLRVYPAR